MKTFKCHFGNGLHCTVEVQDEVPAKGENHIKNVIWKPDKPRFTPKLISKYIQWFNTVEQQLANEWNCTIAHAYDTDRGVILYKFSPNQKPQHIKI